MNRILRPQMELSNPAAAIEKQTWFILADSLSVQPRTLAECRAVSGYFFLVRRLLYWRKSGVEKPKNLSQPWLIPNHVLFLECCHRFHNMNLGENPVRRAYLALF